MNERSVHRPEAGSQYRSQDESADAWVSPSMLVPEATPDGRFGLRAGTDGPGHYIGPHRDSTVHMAPGAAIVTISFGETRNFRLAHGAVKRDFPAANGAVFVLPYATNRVWKHGVPKSTRYTGRRISVTLRALDPR